MTITICGSMSFAQEILVMQKRLLELGYKVIVPLDAVTYAGNPVKLPEKWDKTGEDWIKRYYGEIVQSDAILVINLTKNSVQNYIGGNSFLEMGFAHVLGKTIYLLNPVPEMTYREEMMAMNPVVIHGDITQIHG
jgi:hypothetical protein